MPRTETTNEFIYDEELMGELLLAYQAAQRVTESVEGTIGVLRAYADMRIAQYHHEADREWMSESGSGENG